MSDIIDRAAGLSSGDALYSARRFRPEFTEGAELCRLSVLQPLNNQGLSAGLRAALAYRMAALNADQPLMAYYEALMAEQTQDAAEQALANGSHDLPQPLAAIARQADLVTLTPAQAAESDMQRLTDAGLNNAQIVALSELIAFINFQSRVVTGLRLLRSL